ncbi:HNH endonuclease [Ralstonia phage GP4]|uniref:HNH endonuclease n=1 Tax=Ralstonia phage GP4 TaxID=2282904 RepID=A0A345GTT9_9CAUD|nr:HNH endonuclease [Ralstonia phage GP4]AXG67703.1 HNH endonuclease [Ralstonia phage GP4]
MTRIRPITEDEAAEIARVLAYEPASGRFFHRVDKRGGRVKAGAEVKCQPGKDGYARIGVDGRIYLAHRLAWLLVHGEWPELQIDHIDHNRANNRISNLRIVTATGNMRNRTMRKDNTSGITGVMRDGTKWMAYYYDGGKMVCVGKFVSKEAAAVARKAANDRHGFHENHGKPFACEVA